MALKFHLNESMVGVPFETAYAKIARFEGAATHIDYQVDIFASQDARQSNAMYVAGRAYRREGTPEGNLMELLYADLKTRPGFENAEDC